MRMAENDTKFPYQKVMPASPTYSDSAASDLPSVGESTQRTSMSDDSVEENSYDSPIDFSMKRRKLAEQDKTVKPVLPAPDDPDLSSRTADNWQAAADAAAVAVGGTLEGVTKPWDMIGKPQLAMPSLVSGAALAGYGAVSMMNRFPSGVLPRHVLAASSPLDSTAIKAANGVKSPRLFKSYSKDASFYGIPGLYPIPGMDLATAQSEEMLKSYRNYMYKLQQAETQALEMAGELMNSDTGDEDDTALRRGDLAYHSAMRAEMSPTTTTSAAVSRKRAITLPDEQKDEAYWERRRKNNEAAKRSRDARRAKEDEIAIRAAFLEQENLKLRVEVAALKNETAKLRCMLYNS